MSDTKKGLAGGLKSLANVIERLCRDFEAAHGIDVAVYRSAVREKRQRCTEITVCVVSDGNKQTVSSGEEA